MDSMMSDIVHACDKIQSIMMEWNEISIDFCTVA